MEVVTAAAPSVADELLRVTDDGTFQPGCAEPWVADILAALLVGNGTRTAIEVGGFRGRTSRALLKAMQPLPWPKSFTVCELEQERADMVQAALDSDGKCNYARVVVANSLDWIPTLPAESVDFCWLDGSHEKEHVYNELCALRQKLAPGALLCGHDVFGSCDLQQVFSLFASQTGWLSMSISLPMLGPAGGIGIVQVPR